jgi:hypothetical protein
MYLRLAMVFVYILVVQHNFNCTTSAYSTTVLLYLCFNFVSRITAIIRGSPRQAESICESKRPNNATASIKLYLTVENLIFTHNCGGNIIQLAFYFYV